MHYMTTVYVHFVHKLNQTVIIAFGLHSNDDSRHMPGKVKIVQVRSGSDRSVHLMLAVLITINPEKGLLWDPDPGPPSPSGTYA